MLYIINFLIITNLYAGLQELETKQDIRNIRYFTKDGKVTYFQSNSGLLSFSKNYETFKVLKLAPLTQYEVIATKNKKKIIITADTNFHTKLNVLKKKDIYIANYSNTKALKVDSGISPRLHLQDKFLSYYDNFKREIIIKDTSMKKKKSLLLENKIDPYFIPLVDMISPDDIIYTDIDSKGYQGVYLYSLIDKKRKTIYRLKRSYGQLDFCRIKDDLIIGEWGQSNYKMLSQITLTPLYNNKNFINKRTLYSSSFNDRGTMQCLKDKIYFIKAYKYNVQLNNFVFDVAELNSKTLELSKITSDSGIQQLLAHDGLLLGMKNGKTYLLKGDDKKISSDNLEEGSGK